MRKIANTKQSASWKKAVWLAHQPTVNFYELAGLIVELHNGSSMQDLAKDTGMSRRRLYYLIEVGEFIRDWKISQAGAERVGGRNFKSSRVTSVSQAAPPKM